jgi:hypothetical protein
VGRQRATRTGHRTMLMARPASGVNDTNPSFTSGADVVVGMDRRISGSPLPECLGRQTISLGNAVIRTMSVK